MNTNFLEYNEEKNLKDKTHCPKKLTYKEILKKIPSELKIDSSNFDDTKSKFIRYIRCMLMKKELGLDSDEQDIINDICSKKAGYKRYSELHEAFLRLMTATARRPHITGRQKYCGSRIILAMYGLGFTESEQDMTNKIGHELPNGESEEAVIYLARHRMLRSFYKQCGMLFESLKDKENLKNMETVFKAKDIVTMFDVFQKNVSAHYAIRPSQEQNNTAINRHKLRNTPTQTNASKSREANLRDELDINKLNRRAKDIEAANEKRKKEIGKYSPDQLNERKARMKESAMKFEHYGTGKSGPRRLISGNRFRNGEGKNDAKEIA